MKYYALLLFLSLAIACKEAPRDPGQPDLSLSEVTDTPKYPEPLQKVFEAHGGLDQWKKMRTLSFQMGDETHTTDLYSRADRIESPSFALGFDGQEVWLADPEKAYEGDPVFYHNLMFYFYAMPFVLSDDGIRYGKADDLIHDGRHFPGIRISYDSGVGTSPEDEYFLHYDPETRRMAWLGYTVTYFSGEASEDVHWIRYDDWLEVNGLLLPETLTWYTYEGRTPLKPRDSVTFGGVVLSEAAKPDGFYEPPAHAVPVEEKE